MERIISEPGCAHGALVAHVPWIAVITKLGSSPRITTSRCCDTVGGIGLTTLSISCGAKRRLLHAVVRRLQSDHSIPVADIHLDPLELARQQEPVVGDEMARLLELVEALLEPVLRCD